jgi:hypothetical protein
VKTSITKHTDNELTIEVKIKLTGSMLESEQMILARLSHKKLA